MVSMGRWSDPWSHFVAICHLRTLLSAQLLPHTRSMAVPALGNVMVPPGISSLKSWAIIISRTSSDCSLCFQCSVGFHSRWCKLKSPTSRMQS